MENNEERLDEGEQEQLTADQEELMAKKCEDEVILQDVDVNSLAKKTEGHAHKHVDKDDHQKKGHVDVKSMVVEIEDLKGQILRRRAEFENYKKRVETEKQEFSKYAQEKTLAELLVIIDSFDRAMKPVENEAQEAKQLLNGFTLIYKQFMDFLTKQGVVEMSVIGQKFNPEFHQSVSLEASEDFESGVITKEYQKGYMLHSRVIRPSMVVVTQ